MQNYNLGIHVFEELDLDWEEEIICINLLSILSWKRFHGPIQIYCNTKYKQTLQKWGLDSLYDKINTDVIDNKPLDIDYEQNWAFVKFLVLKEVKNLTPFTLVDNDLWIIKRLDMNSQNDVTMYHFEGFSNDYINNIYEDFDYLVPQKVINLNLDKNISPTNTALLSINNGSFIDEWVNLCEEIASYNKNIELRTRNKSIKMCFLEQRLLPMLLTKRGLTYSTYLEHTYLSHKAEPQDGSEWYPLLENSTESQIDKFSSIKHVWGMKKLFRHFEVRKLIITNCLTNLMEYDINDKPYTQLIIKMINTYQNS